MRLPERIAILGSGWLGLPLAARLVKDGFHVNASTTEPSRSGYIEGIGATSFIFNINQISDITRNFLNSDTLIVAIPSRDVESFGELIEEIGFSPVRNVLYVSSTSVYPNNNSVITEDDGVETPSSPFFIIEKLFRENPRFRTTVVRFGGLIGPGRHPGRFFSKGRPVKNPEAPVNLIHLDDCIGLILHVLESGSWGEVFNGVADTHPSRRDFYSMATSSLGLSAPVFSDDGAADFKVVSNAKSKELLGYEYLHFDLMQLNFEDLEAGAAKPEES